jgi:Skp family chaperone for outer membrane proteins
MTRCWISIVVLQFCLVGCSYSSTTTQGNVAIVDLDEAAKQLGLSEQWSAQLSEQQTKVNEQLVNYQQQLNEQLKAKQAEVVATNTTEDTLAQPQQAELASYQQELNGKLRTAKTQAEQHLATARIQVIHQFRDMAKQISMEVALENGYDVVLTKNDSVVFNYSPNTDITSQVVERLKTQLPSQQTTARE